ncbi:MAG: thermonuclease family protein, partial [Akkermansiaceae bacterium]
TLGTVLTVVVIAAVIWMKYKEAKADGDSEAKRPDKELTRPTETSTAEPPPRKPDTKPAPPVANSNRLLSQLTPARATSSKFTTIDGCRLIDHRHNDGDSFHVNVPGKGDMELRLYYADTPESLYKEYRDGNNNGKRISEQGAYFGGLNRTNTTKVGADAKYFVKDLLKGKSFTISSQWESVYRSHRKYAFIIVGWKGKDVYLHELLVAHGLARIHTKPMTLPDNTASSRHKTRLYALEKQAKKNKLGAWGL